MKVPPKGRNEVAAVLRGVMTGGTRVQAAHDWIGNNQLDTAGAKLMGEAAGRLTELDLSETSLLPDQVKAIFTSASKHQSQLRRLNVEGNDLSWVPIRDLVAALSSMEEIVRALTSFTSSQIRAVLNVDFPKHGWRRMRVFFSMAGLNLSGRL